MRRKGNTKLNKFFKAMGLISAVFVLLTSVCLVAFLVLDIIDVNTLVSDGPRYYTIQFADEYSTISTNTYRRGDKIVFPKENPVRFPDEDEDYNYTYTFKGWDITGDNISDLLPHYAYYSFLAKAVFSRTSIAKPKPSSSKEDDSSSSSSSSKPWNPFHF